MVIICFQEHLNRVNHDPKNRVQISFSQSGGTDSVAVHVIELILIF